MSYFVRMSGNVFGPYTESQLLEMKAKGKIARATEISPNERDWQTAETLPFLYGHAAPTIAQPPVQEWANRFQRMNAGGQDEPLLSELPEEEPEPDISFEIRLKGKRVSVTRSKLFELARTGQVLPDDTVLVDGTKVFADSIRGIVFSEGAPIESPPPNVKTPAAKPLAIHKSRSSTASNLENSGVLNASHAEEEPFYLVVPPRRKGIAIGELGNTFQSLLSRFYPSEGGSPFPIIVIFASILGMLCLLGMGFYLMSGNNYGTVIIEGMVTLDGAPVSGVSVTLHPRDKSGTVAGGITKKNGKFTVTTDIVVDPSDPLRGTVPMVSGVKPGEYDITFYKLAENDRETQTIGSRSVPKYAVPQRYGDVKTSGLEPIRVSPEEKTKFTFELTTANDESP